MKKIVLFLNIVAASFVFGQIKTNLNVAQNTITTQTPFLDASSSATWNGTTNQGKGLVFPRTDLTTLAQLVATPNGIGSSYPGRLDGMVVYNTGTGTAASGTAGVNVTPGFYYYDNKSATLNGGTWKPFTPAVATGPANGSFWALTGNSGITPIAVTETQGTPGNPSTYTYTMSAGNFIGTTDANNVVIASNSVPRLEIGSKTAQNVGGANFNFVLDVYGKARFRDGLVTSNSTYPDYVFDKYFTGASKENANYNFLTLAQTEKYIKENNHLPGVTSIKDLSKENGKYMIDATQLSVQSLEKIEELYLHTIEQQKEIDALKAEIKAIKQALATFSN